MADETAASDQSLEVCVQTPPPALLAKKVTRKNLARVQEKHLLRNIDALMATLFPALIKKVKDGNIQAIRLTAEIANLVKTQGGVTISQTMLQANSNSSNSGTRYSYDALIRKLDKQGDSASVIDVSPE
jgi:hypothetical protein